MVAEGAPLPRSIRIGLLLSVSLVVLSLAGVLAIRTAMRQLALPVFGEVPDFALVDQEGQPFTRADLDGLIHLVAFIYTSCPDICPATSARMAAFQAELARAGLTDKVHLLSITVDPEYDTPERLTAYARIYGADTSSWRFLTGELHEVRSLVEEGFLVGMQQVPTNERVHAFYHHDASAPEAGAHQGPGSAASAADAHHEHGAETHTAQSHHDHGSGASATDAHHNTGSETPVVDAHRNTGFGTPGADALHSTGTEPSAAASHHDHGPGASAGDAPPGIESAPTGHHAVTGSSKAQQAADYRVEHSGRVALVDREGRIRAFHDGNLLNSEDVMAQIRQLLAGR